MRKRNWLVEDNLIALYIAIYGDKGLPLSEKEIAHLVRHKDFSMRVRQFLAIDTQGARGLKAGLKSPLFCKLYRLFVKMAPETFHELIVLILNTKNRIRIANDRAKSFV